MVMDTLGHRTRVEFGQQLNLRIVKKCANLSPRRLDSRQNVKNCVRDYKICKKISKNVSFYLPRQAAAAPLQLWGAPRKSIEGSEDETTQNGRKKHTNHLKNNKNAISNHFGHFWIFSKK